MSTRVGSGREQDQFLDVIDRDEAERRFHAALDLSPLGEEIVALSDAWGRVLSQDVAAPVDVPFFDRSNVDGYAVRAADTFGAQEERSRRLSINDESIAAGVVPATEVAPGAAISFAGSDIGRGEIVLRRGEVLSSRETGVLAALGVERVTVYRRPRVAILSTGDELIAPGQPMRPGLVYDSNATILADAVRELGGEPVAFGIVPDQEPPLRATLTAALEH